MTKEEAKKRLEIWLICMDCPEDKLCYDSHLHSLCEYTDYCDDVSISEAIKVAIKSLEQEPCDDAINRRDIGLSAIEIVMCDGDYKQALEMLLDKIQKAPSVNPQKTGKWEILPKSEFDSSTKDHIRCTNCGREPFGDIPYMFCPNCGAKMESEEK